MILETIKMPLSIFIMGLITGWYFTKKYIVKTHTSLGHAIESIMISRNIKEINEHSNTLNDIVAKLNLSGEQLLDRLQKAQDIERPLDLNAYELYDLSKIEINEH
jgi:hypothetical protein